MSNNNWSQFSLATLLIAFAMVALPLGLSTWRGDYAFLICASLALLLWAATRRKVFAFALLAYIFVFPAGAFFTIVSTRPSNPYVRSFNQRLEKMAKDANLVGSSEDQVEIVLGPATSIYSGWNATTTSTGEPAPGARFNTTYNYAPYPSFPFSKFQVHCHGGKVTAIELYDD